MPLKCFLAFALLISLPCFLFANNYIVNSKATLVSKTSVALPGDTITVANGTYNWGQISLTNTKGDSSSSWIVVQAETPFGVTFSGGTFLQFGGYRIMVTGFKFANGTSGLDDVIQFRNSSKASAVEAYYCRLNNIIIDNYNSDTAGCQQTPPAITDTLNRWVSFYGKHNRMDHCTFINKYNGGPTIAIMYDSANYPIGGFSTYHLIDSNYFKGRGWQGGNEGETIRVGLGSMSNNDGYNIIEHNLIQYGTSTDPEIFSNKSNLNTYRYNTIKDATGGITMRQGRYNSVYGNFILKTTATKVKSSQYGIRVIDKGQKVFNNYIEGVNGNSGKLNTTACPIVIYSGQSPAVGLNPTIPGYYSSDSSIIAFNTIVNCYGGAGIQVGLGKADKGVSAAYKPQGLIIANNIINMAKGQAIAVDTTSYPAAVDPFSGVSNTLPVTYFAEGNLYSAPSNLGITKTNGFSSQTLKFGTRTNGILPPPSLVQGAAINSLNYDSLLNGVDALGKARTSPYSVGAIEVNGTGTVVVYPLDSTMVGAGTPIVPLPVSLSSFTGTINNSVATFTWKVENEISMKGYQLEYSSNGINFTTITTVGAVNKTVYTFQHKGILVAKNYYRLKLINKDGSYVYSGIIMLSEPSVSASISLYPNPAIGFITLNARNINPNSHIELTDFSGRCILKQDIVSCITRVSIQGVAIGMCHLALYEGNKRIMGIPFLLGK